jgi:hypothetical protein
MQFDAGWSKSALAEDLPHVLEAIIEGLDNEVSWPDAAERATLAQEHPGIFHNCIGIVDIWQITALVALMKSAYQEYSKQVGAVAWKGCLTMDQKSSYARNVLALMTSNSKKWMVDPRDLPLLAVRFHEC